IQRRRCSHQSPMTNAVTMKYAAEPATNSAPTGLTDTSPNQISNRRHCGTYKPFTMKDEGTGRDSWVHGNTFLPSYYLLDFSLQRSEPRQYSTQCARRANSKSTDNRSRT